MEYEVIIIGATFAAAGLIEKYKEKALILERRPQAGYEFFNAINFGNEYSAELKSDEAIMLFERFKSKNIFAGERVCIFDCAYDFYKCLADKNVLLNMEIISVEKQKDCFLVTAHGVSGYRTYKAKKVIDTRVHKEMILSKTLNAVLKTSALKNFVLPEGVKMENWGYDDDIVVKCMLSAEEDYVSARRKLFNAFENMHEDLKPLLVADTFGYELKDGYPKEENGIYYMPSCAYKNPLLAFDAGVIYASEGI
ncbi:MAG: hypothetical protein II978_05310 [Clostridia bacterium]|nr:hypothetical protein [Clostridia bacterium]